MPDPVTLARERYPWILWDFQDADPILVKRLLVQFERLAGEWSVAARFIKYVGLKWDTSSDDFAITHHDPAGHPDTVNTHRNSIWLNPAYYRDAALLDQLLLEQVRIGYHPLGTGSVEATFTHEFGHVLLHVLSDHAPYALLPYVASNGFGAIGPTVREWLAVHQAGADLSEYALTNADEGWAEGFAALHFGTPRTEYTNAQQGLLDRLNKTKWLDRWTFVQQISDSALRAYWQSKLAQLARDISMEVPRMAEQPTNQPKGTEQPVTLKLKTYADVRQSIETQARIVQRPQANPPGGLGQGDGPIALLNQIDELLNRLAAALGAQESTPSDAPSGKWCCD